MTLVATHVSTQYLVLTAIGKNKTGLVSELTGLAYQCNCNVVDSKMAIFGGEFTMLMLLSGDAAALAQLEMQLPPLAMELDLLTMMKRTTKHQGLDKAQFLLTIEGPDQAGTIRKLTSFLAQNKVSISSLKSKTLVKHDQEWQQAEIRVELPDEVNLEHIISGIEQECEKLNMESTIRPITIED